MAALESVRGLSENLGLLAERDVALAESLAAEGQQEIFAAWDAPGTGDAEKLDFFKQIRTLDGNYPGGLGCYLRNARGLLQASAEGANPLAGWTPSVPRDTFRPEVGSEEFMAYEELGASEVGACCFVIPAGGLGERLGFHGVKLALPAELVTPSKVLEVYCAYLRAFQDLAEKKSSSRSRLPLVIMASSDTEAGIRSLLESNNYFGLEPEQVTILLQEKVAALARSDALLSMEGRYKVGTKPHGHGDIHFLLHSKGMAKRWLEEGRRWVLFFQDTNTLYLTTFLCSLGVSVKHGLRANVVAMPRKAKEAVGSIARLTHSDGKCIVANVEYNQLEPLLKATGGDGDVNGPDGFSPYPGNTNELIFSLPQYVSVLEETGGQMPEFINPKYTDASRSTFKSPTRLECMMQDFLKLLPAEEVGVTCYPLEFGYFPCKNDIATAARLAAEGTPPHGAASAEAAVYHAYAELLRRVGRTSHVAAPTARHWCGGPQLLGPAVVLWPSFAPSCAELRRRLGEVVLEEGSTLEVRGDVHLGRLTLAGALRVVAGEGATLHVPQLEVRNRGGEFVALTEAEQAGEAPEELRIRGYR
ncbi:unnamed protein product, partial [Effrenium voratum]